MDEQALSFTWIFAGFIAAGHPAGRKIERDVCFNYLPRQTASKISFDPFWDAKSVLRSRHARHHKKAPERICGKAPGRKVFAGALVWDHAEKSLREFCKLARDVSPC